MYICFLLRGVEQHRERNGKDALYLPLVVSDALKIEFWNKPDDWRH